MMTYKIDYSPVAISLAKKWLITLCLLFSCIDTMASQLSASVDRDTIGIQETLILTLSADDRVHKEPDLSELKSDFDVLGTSRSQSTRILQWQCSVHNRLANHTSA
jgi:hypothetical protein